MEPSDRYKGFLEGFDSGKSSQRRESYANLSMALDISSFALASAITCISLSGFSNMGTVEFVKVVGSLALSFAPAILGGILLSRNNAETNKKEHRHR